MKKLFITSALLLSALFVSAQAKTPEQPAAPPRQAYQPNMATPLTITVPAIYAGYINNFLLVHGYGSPAAIRQSEMKAKDVEGAIVGYSTTLDSVASAISRSLVKFDKESRAKFTADTNALYHPVKADPKKK